MPELIGCYARALGDCAGPLTREHQVSASVLRLFNRYGVSGTSWIPEGEVRELSANALAAKTLCKKHNGDLAGLDAAIEPLFRRIAELIDVESQENFRLIPELQFPAALLGRWILKAFCGHVASGWIRGGQRKLQSRDIPVEWLAILFGVHEWPEPIGLFSEYKKLEFDWQHLYKAQLPIADGDKIFCYRCWIFGIPFFITVEPINDVLGDLMRPAGIAITRWGEVKRIEIVWDRQREPTKWLRINVP